MELDAAQLDYMQLAVTTGIGPCLLRRLLDQFGTATAVLSASPQELCAVAGINVTLQRRLRSAEFRDRALIICDDCSARDISILFPADDQFPRLLREIADPPSLLFVRGELRATDALAIAIVGTRGASQYGRSQAERFSRSLARAGLTIVSGLARGIDSAAHLGALEAEGRTIAVQSNGVAQIYPPQNQALAERILASGAVISEWPPGTKPK